MIPLNSKQATTYDYTNKTDYDKGHIFPSSHAHNEKDKIATFTLTNTVPQAKTFNQGSWRKMEQCIKCVMHEYCFNQHNQLEAFVVTGAISSANENLNNKVNIPKTLWTAFCCHSKAKDQWLASAHWGDNVKENPKDKKFMETKNIVDLISLIEVDPFPQHQCRLNVTVSKYYPTLRKTCQCPPAPLTTTAPPTSTSAPPTSTSAHPTSTSAPPSSKDFQCFLFFYFVLFLT